MNGDVYTLTIRPVKHSSGNTPARRLAAWLKIGLRSFGLKCVAMRAGVHQDERSGHKTGNDTPNALESGNV
jgi:hypothetical protein